MEFAKRSCLRRREPCRWALWWSIWIALYGNDGVWMSAGGNWDDDGDAEYLVDLARPAVVLEGGGADVDCDTSVPVGTREGAISVGALQKDLGTCLYYGAVMKGSHSR